MQQINIKFFNEKKAVSILIGYVLLISFAIIMGALVYGWMASYVPKDLLDCPEGSAVFIKDVTCDKDTLELTLILENTGRFDLAGYFIHATDNITRELATVDLSQKLVSGGALLGSAVIFASKNENSISPGDTTTQTKFILDKEIYSIEIIPMRFQEEEGKQRLASCGDAKTKQVITCNIFSPLGISGIVSWWDFNNVTADDNVEDIIGSKNGTRNGDVNCSIAGINGTACYFNGSNGDYINVNGDLDFTDFTAMAWVNISGNGYGDGSSGIFNAERTSLAGFEFSVDSNYGVWMMVGNTTNNDTLNTSANVITQDSWHHIAIVGASGQYMKIYVDGVENASKLTTQIISDPVQAPYIGTYDSLSNGNMNGTIDELMVFNRSLSGTEINTLMNYFS